MAKKKKTGKKKRPKKAKIKKNGYSKVSRIIFINGKQKRVWEEYMDGIPIHEWEWQNMDSIAALERGHYDKLYQLEEERYRPAPLKEESTEAPAPNPKRKNPPRPKNAKPAKPAKPDDDDSDLPF